MRGKDRKLSSDIYHGMGKAQNWAGQKYNSLTFIKPTEQRSQGNIVWELLCDCGSTVFRVARRVIDGDSISCGCHLFNDLAGQKFGRWTFIKRHSEKSASGAFLWQVECDCGAICNRRPDTIISGSSKSCGCYSSEYQIYTNRKYEPHISTARSVWHCTYSDCDFDTFLYLSQLPCVYCGGQPSNSSSIKSNTKSVSTYQQQNGTFIYNGLDRIDSTKGHTRDNIVPCCRICNWMKSNLTLDEFLAHIDRIHSLRRNIHIDNQDLLEAGW